MYRVGCGSQLLARAQDGEGPDFGARAYPDFQPASASVEHADTEVDDDCEPADGNLYILEDDSVADLTAGSSVVVDLELKVVLAVGGEPAIGEGSLIGKCGPDRDLKCRRVGAPSQHHSGTDQQSSNDQNPYRSEPAVGHC